MSILRGSPIPASPAFDTVFDGARFWAQRAIAVKASPDAESKGREGDVDAEMLQPIEWWTRVLEFLKKPRTDDRSAITERSVA